MPRLATEIFGGAIGCYGQQARNGFASYPALSMLCDRRKRRHRGNRHRSDKLGARSPRRVGIGQRFIANGRSLTQFKNGATPSVVALGTGPGDSFFGGRSPGRQPPQLGHRGENISPDRPPISFAHLVYRYTAKL